MMQRTLSITDTSFSLHEWQDKQLLGRLTFAATEEGESALVAYLKNARTMPMDIIVDLLEEDIRRESIPHVGIKDRQTIIARTVKRLHPDNDFVYSKRISKPKSKSKPAQGKTEQKDEILMTALSSMGRLSEWLMRLSNEKTVIRRIYSLPVLSRHLLPQLNCGNNLLLLTRQQQAPETSVSIRETYFDHGEVFLSRLVKPLTGQDHFDSEGGDYLTEDDEQVRRFLSNRRIIDFNEDLEVVCLVPKALQDDAVRISRTRKRQSYNCIALEWLFAGYGLSAKVPHTDMDASTLFSYLALFKADHKGHYGTEQQRRLYLRARIDGHMSQAALLAGLCCLTLAGGLLLHAAELRRQYQDADRQEGLLSAFYSEHYEPIETQLEKADLMLEANQLAAKIRTETTLSPEVYLVPISRILARGEFRDLWLSSINFKKLSGDDLRTLRNEISEIGLNPVIRSEDEYYEEEEEYYEEDTQPSLTPSLVIRGFLFSDKRNYRETVALIQELTLHLNQLPLVEATGLRQIPVDVRQPRRFEDRQGLIEDNRSDIQKDRFELVLLLKTPSTSDTDDQLADAQP